MVADMGDVSSELARFARQASHARSVAGTVEQIVGFARDAVGTDYAGITLLLPSGKLDSVGVTSPIVLAADQLQYELGEGPCLQATVNNNAHTLLSTDVRVDPRWRNWGPRAGQLGLISILSAELRARGRRIGGLNLYGERSRQFDGDDAAIAHLFAIHAAVALAAAVDEEHLRTAIDTRTQIGQAQGILMERFDLDADQAFGVLRRYSQTTNTKLHRVAQTLIDTRELPDAYHDG